MNVDDEGSYPAGDLEAAEALGSITPPSGQVLEENEARTYAQAGADAGQPMITETNEPFDELIDLCVLERQHPREAHATLDACPQEHWICPSDQVEPLLGTDRETVSYERAGGVVQLVRRG